MEPTLARNHPTQKLLFFIAQEVHDDDRRIIRDFVEKLGAARKWMIDPPKMVDEIDEPENPAVDNPVVTVGAYLEIYSALLPLQLSREIDLRNFEDVSVLIEAVCGLSKRNNLVFEFELDGKFVGSIEHGVMDRSLRDGLLGEWRKQFVQ